MIVKHRDRRGRRDRGRAKDLARMRDARVERCRPTATRCESAGVSRRASRRRSAPHDGRRRAAADSGRRPRASTNRGRSPASLHDRPASELDRRQEPRRARTRRRPRRAAARRRPTRASPRTPPAEIEHILRDRRAHCAPGRRFRAAARPARCRRASRRRRARASRAGDPAAPAPSQPPLQLPASTSPAGPAQHGIDLRASAASSSTLTSTTLRAAPSRHVRQRRDRIDDRRRADDEHDVGRLDRGGRARRARRHRAPRRTTRRPGRSQAPHPQRKLASRRRRLVVVRREPATVRAAHAPQVAVQFERRRRCPPAACRPSTFWVSSVTPAARVAPAARSPMPGIRLRRRDQARGATDTTPTPARLSRERFRRRQILRPKLPPQPAGAAKHRHAAFRRDARAGQHDDALAARIHAATAIMITATLTTRSYTHRPTCSRPVSPVSCLCRSSLSSDRLRRTSQQRDESGARRHRRGARRRRRTVRRRPNSPPPSTRSSSPKRRSRSATIAWPSASPSTAASARRTPPRRPARPAPRPAATPSALVAEVNTLLTQARERLTRSDALRSCPAARCQEQRDDHRRRREAPARSARGAGGATTTRRAINGATGLAARLRATLTASRRPLRRPPPRSAADARPRCAVSAMRALPVRSS